MYLYFCFLVQNRGSDYTWSLSNLKKKHCKKEIIILVIIILSFSNIVFYPIRHLISPLKYTEHKWKQYTFILAKK